MEGWVFNEPVAGSSSVSPSITPKPLQPLQLPVSPWYPSLTSSTALIRIPPWSPPPPSPVMSPDSSLSHAQGPAWASLQLHGWGKSLAYQTVSKSESEGEFGLELFGVVFSPSQAVIRVMKGSSPLCCHPYSNQQPLPIKQVTHQT